MQGERRRARLWGVGGLACYVAEVRIRQRFLIIIVPLLLTGRQLNFDK